jgi:hypothetical protein
MVVKISPADDYADSERDERRRPDRDSASRQ